MILIHIFYYSFTIFVSFVLVSPPLFLFMFVISSSNKLYSLQKGEVQSHLLVTDEARIVYLSESNNLSIFFIKFHSVTYLNSIFELIRFSWYKNTAGNKLYYDPGFYIALTCESGHLTEVLVLQVAI